MKKTIFLILSFLSCLNASEFLTSKLPVKEGYIELVSYGTKNGTSTIYFKDYGKEVAIYKKFDSHIMSGSNQIIIIKNKEELVIDPKTKTAIKRETLQSSLIKEFNSLSQIDKDYILSTKTDKILDFECRDIVIDGINKCYNALFYLSSDIDIFGYSEHNRAISYKEESVLDSYFTPPSDLKIKRSYENIEKTQNIIKSMLE